jgi:hypothetical protein
MRRHLWPWGASLLWARPYYNESHCCSVDGDYSQDRTKYGIVNRSVNVLVVPAAKTNEDATKGLHLVSNSSSIVSVIIDNKLSLGPSPIASRILACWQSRTTTERDQYLVCVRRKALPCCHCNMADFPPTIKDHLIQKSC